MNFVFDGQVVEVTFRGKKLRCEVICAAGNDARVANELHQVDTWVSVDDLTPVPDEVAGVADWRQA